MLVIYLQSIIVATTRIEKVLIKTLVAEKLKSQVLEASVLYQVKWVKSCKKDQQCLKINFRASMENFSRSNVESTTDPSVRNYRFSKCPRFDLIRVYCCVAVNWT